MPVEEGLGSLESMLVRRSPAAWLEGFGRIKVKDRSLGENGLRWLHEARLGWLQRRLCEVVSWCLKNQKPIRLLVYKKRQTGASTGSVGLLYWFCRTLNMDALIVGAKHKQVQNLWEILKTYHTWDRHDWGHAANVLTNGATFGNGSRVVHESLQSNEPGRSGAWTFLLATEVARWAEEGVKNASDVLTGISNGVSRSPLSCVIWETTVRGGSGAFFEKWQGAVEFEEFQQGEEGNGFIRIFEPWFFGFDSSMPCSPREREDILAGRGAADAEEAMVESELRTTYQLTPEQIKFWRWALNDCQGDPDQRDRDFPTTPEHGFRASIPGRFNLKCLRHMMAEAQVASAKERRFVFLAQPDRHVERFVDETRPKADDAQFMMFERPMEGHRYLLTIDPMRGLEDEEIRDRDKRDTHGVVVLRDGYHDASLGRWVRPKVVACSLPKCRWPITELAEATFRLAWLYGGCLMVPEANFDSGLILLLRQRGAIVYERERPATDKDAGERTGKFGFLTRGQDGEASRRWIIENLARAIRFWNRDAEGVEVPAEHIVDELQNFVTKDGKDQALAGKHDDHVLALAMAVELKRAATPYRERVFTPALPPDVRVMQARRGMGSSGTHRK